MSSPVRRVAFGLAVLALATTGCVVLARLTTTGQAVGHRPGHKGCPPGSHGRLWSADAGRRLQQAFLSRQWLAHPPDADALAERALTAPLRSR